MAEEKNIKADGASLNLVAPSDPYAINAPFANYSDAYTVLAHGPTSKGELFLYSRQDCRDNSCAKVTPKELANIIKNDTNYHQGQAVALFSCNAGKWASASYAQVLSNELGVQVIAPTENIVGVSFSDLNDKGRVIFKEWIVQENIKQVEPNEYYILGHLVYRSYDKTYADPSGKTIYLDRDKPGEFSTFSPTRKIEADDKINEIDNNISPQDKHSSAYSISNVQKLAYAHHEISKLVGGEGLPQAINLHLAEIGAKNNVTLTIEAQSQNKYPEHQA